MLELALRYGSALHSLALDLNKVELWQKEMKELTKLLTENNEFLNLLNSEFLSIKERKQIVNNTIIFDDAELNAFINIIIDNNRVSNLLEILEAFNSLCNQTLGILEGVIFSVERLDESQISSIETAIAKKEQVKIELKNVIDKSLIGGLKVFINGHVYDDSIKYHLEKMKNSLRK